MVRLTREMKGMPVEGGLPVDLADDVFMGHEFSAEVLEAGPDTDAPSPGTVVTSLPVLLSPNGFEPILSSNTAIGGYAERMLLSAPLLLTIPNGLDPRHASLTEPMAVGLHAVNKSSVQPGEAALVIGCGPIGLAIIAALRQRGVESIVAADYSHKRRDLATMMGAHQTVDPAKGSPFDDVTPAVVFEAVGMPGVVNDVMRSGTDGHSAGRRGGVHGGRYGLAAVRHRQGDQRAVRECLRSHRVRRGTARHRRGRDRRRSADYR